MATAAPPIESNETTHRKRRLHDPYLWHRLHSASGIFPIGFFLVQHMIANSYALRGAAAYDTVIKVYGGLPFVAVMEIALIYVPILYHAIYGFWIAAYGSANLGRYSYGRNWLYFLQRASGVIAFFYIGYHVWHTSLAKYQLLWQGNKNPEQAISYLAMSHQMAQPFMFGVMAIGIIATVFHFTNGLWNFCVRWGITVSAHSQRVNQYVCWGLFIVFTLMGLATLNHLRIDGRNHTSTVAPSAAVMTH